MTQQDKKQLKLEIDHIFESGANEIRIFKMVVNFIDSRNGVNKNFVLADVSSSFYSDGNNYSHLEVNSDQFPEHEECVMCGSTQVTITDDADICHDCGYVYT